MRTPRPRRRRSITVTALTNGKTYTCTVTAKNSQGSSPPSPPSVAVVPATVPAAPKIVSAASGDASVRISFAPQGDNGSPITSFTVTCTSTNGGVPGSLTGPSSPIVVTGLTNGDVYRCTVKATNAIGAGAASAASVALIVGQPGTPTITSIVPGNAPASTGGFHVFFDPGPANGSAITSFRATCLPVSTGASGVGVGTTSPITVSGLTTAHAYSCFVVAANARATSTESKPVRATVGTPAPPSVVSVLALAHGLALPFLPAASNGRPVLNYRARCTSGNGGVPGSPVQITSPLVATHLSAGRSYRCLVTAINARGEGPPAQVGPVVVGVVPGTMLAGCTGNSGSMTATPGIQLSTAKTHTLTLHAALGGCSGPYVRGAQVSFSFHSKRAFSCNTAIDVPNAGSGRITWNAPVGMGTSAATIQFVIDSSSGHTTTAHFSGTVTSQANLFTDAHVDGSVTLRSGITSTDAGGDCSSSTRLGSFVISSIALTIS